MERNFIDINGLRQGPFDFKSDDIRIISIYKDNVIIGTQEFLSKKNKTLTRKNSSQPFDVWKTYKTDSKSVFSSYYHKKNLEANYQNDDSAPSNRWTLTKEVLMIR